MAQIPVFESVPAWQPGNRLPQFQKVFEYTFGDIDRDGTMDMVNVCRRDIAVYYGTGDSYIFAPENDWSAGSGTDHGGAALGDVDADGDLDLVFAGRVWVDPQLEVRSYLFLNVNGVFERRFTRSSTNLPLPSDIDLADIDNDGDLDMLCGGDYPCLYENVGGSEIFGVDPSWCLEDTLRAQRIAIGDLDGDGDLDLVCASSLADSGTCVFLNRYDGALANAFGQAPDWATPAGARRKTSDLSLGDLDGDGDLDLVTVGVGGCRVWLNIHNENPNAIFSAEAIAVTGVTGQCLALGDVDNDGDLDLVCGQDPDAILVYRNTNVNGAIFDTQPSEQLEAAYATAITLADVDGFGGLDLAQGSGTGESAIHLNTMVPFSARSDEQVTYPTLTSSIALADINGDGLKDLAIGASSTGQCRLFLNRDGTLPPPPSWTAQGPLDTRTVVVDDMDGDGLPDLVCGNYQAVAVVYYHVDQPSGVFEPFPGAEVGTFLKQSGSIAVGDVDGNGYPDVVFGRDDAPKALYLNMGGVFEHDSRWIPSVGDSWCLELADMDHDGDLDLMCVDGGGRGESLYLGDGGTFRNAPVWSTPEVHDTRAICLGDVDDDGYVDLVSANRGLPLAMYYNNGGSMARGAVVWPYDIASAADSTRGLALGDIDGDGDLDLVCANYNAANRAYRNERRRITSIPVWSSEESNASTAVGITDLDADGDQDLVYGNYNEQYTVYRGLRNPPYKHNPVAKTNHLPFTDAYLSGVEATKTGDLTYDIGLTVVDLESDDAWIMAEYRYESTATWTTMVLATDPEGGWIGPLATSPAGAEHSFAWDVSSLPITDEGVIVRVRVESVPRGLSEVRLINQFVKELGPLKIERPDIVSPPVIAFTRVTVGDTVSAPLAIANTGNADLEVFDVSLPSTEMRLGQGAPYVVAPGTTVVDTVFLEPRETLAVDGEITITSNDPLAPTVSIAVETLISSLAVETVPLLAGDTAPLGQALTIQTIAPDTVHVQRAALWYRGSGGATFTSIEMTPSGRSFIGIIPGPDVTEAGLEYFVELENSDVFATDPPDTSSGQVFTVQVAAPTVVTVLPVPTSGRDYLAGREIAVQLSLADGVVYEGGTLHYRRGGESAYASAPVEDTGPVPIAVIPDSMVGPRGVEYWVEVKTRTSELTDPPTDPAGSPHSISVRVTDLHEPTSHSGFMYRMVSVPLDFGVDFVGSLEALLADQAAFGPYPGEPYDLGQWRCFRGFPPDGAPRELPAGPVDDFRVEPGRGFWLVSRSEHRITTSPVAGMSTPTNEDFAIILAPGWNMIGHPFAFPAAWDAVLVDGQPVRTAPVEGPWSFDGKSYVDVTLQENPQLEPFAGYWIRNSAEPERDVVLSIPPQESPPATRTTQVAGLVKERDILWQLQISATCAGVQDGANRLGVSASARDTWDGLDRHEPPAAPERSVSLAFPHSLWDERAGRYTADYRAASADAGGYTWMFDVAKDFRDEASGNMVELEFAGLEELPTGQQISLLDRELGRVQNLREKAGYAFHLGVREPVATEADARFVVLVGDAEYIGGQLDDLSTPPLQTVLHQNYPNPFNPETVIRWDVAEAGRVDLKIYDLSGALVRTAHSDVVGPGGYEFVWRGEDDHGRRVASGVYIYRLRAGDVVQTKRMMLIK